MLVFDKVSKEYGDFTALNDISFIINEQEFVSIVGESGAGKSTLLKLLLREDHPTQGAVTFKGINIGDFGDSELPLYRRRIASVFQNFKLLPSKTVFENVAFAMEVSGKSQRDIDEDVPQALNIVELANKSDHFPQELSGGEQQRVAMARALVQRPEVLLADEPTGNLDHRHAWDIFNLLVKINELGTAVLLATHSAEMVNVLKRRVITLEDGKIVSDEQHGKYKVK